MLRYGMLIGLLAWAGVVAAGEAPEAVEVLQPELRKELLRRVKADQQVREAVFEWMKKEKLDTTGEGAANFERSLNKTQLAEFKKLAEASERTDKENTEWLGKIVDKHGWPTRTLVGKDGANAAWLLVQHADLSPQFQRKCLDLMAKAGDDEVSKKDRAYLTDRVLLAEGKKQLYGTQFVFEGGKCKPRPLEDEANVDTRRAEVGLGPLAEYLKESEAIFGGKPGK